MNRKAVQIIAVAIFSILAAWIIGSWGLSLEKTLSISMMFFLVIQTVYREKISPLDGLSMMFYAGTLFVQHDLRVCFFIIAEALRWIAIYHEEGRAAEEQKYKGSLWLLSLAVFVSIAWLENHHPESKWLILLFFAMRSLSWPISAEEFTSHKKDTVKAGSWSLLVAFFALRIYESPEISIGIFVLLTLSLLQDREDAISMFLLMILASADQQLIPLLSVAAVLLLTGELGLYIGTTLVAGVLISTNGWYLNATLERDMVIGGATAALALISRSIFSKNHFKKPDTQIAANIGFAIVLMLGVLSREETIKTINLISGINMIPGIIFLILPAIFYFGLRTESPIFKMIPAYSLNKVLTKWFGGFSEEEEAEVTKQFDRRLLVSKMPMTISDWEPSKIMTTTLFLVTLLTLIWWGIAWK